MKCFFITINFEIAIYKKSTQLSAFVGDEGFEPPTPSV
jgi:hypothetical protein